MKKSLRFARESTKRVFALFYETLILPGAWADYAGRRKPFIMILVGIEVYVVAQTLGVYFYDRINVYYFYLTAEIFSGLCGGLASIMTLALSIVSDDARADRSFVRQKCLEFNDFLFFVDAIFCSATCYYCLCLSISWNFVGNGGDLSS